LAIENEVKVAYLGAVEMKECNLVQGPRYRGREERGLLFLWLVLRRTLARVCFHASVFVRLPLPIRRVPWLLPMESALRGSQVCVFPGLGMFVVWPSDVPSFMPTFIGES